MPASKPTSAFPVDIIHSKKKLKLLCGNDAEKWSSGQKKVYAVVQHASSLFANAQKGRKFTTDDFMCCVKLAVFWSQSQFAIQVYKLDADCKTKKCNVNRSLNQVAIHAVTVVPIQKQRERTGKILKSKLEHRQSHVQ
jgi:hypothetical protein